MDNFAFIWLHSFYDNVNLGNAKSKIFLSKILLRLKLPIWCTCYIHLSMRHDQLSRSDVHTVVSFPQYGRVVKKENNINRGTTCKGKQPSIDYKCHNGICTIFKFLLFKETKLLVSKKKTLFFSFLNLKRTLSSSSDFWRITMSMTHFQRPYILSCKDLSCFINH